MATRVLSDAAGKQIVDSVRSGFAASIEVKGLQVQLKNGQASPAIVSTADIPMATAGAAGAMSAADKAKLDGISAGANSYTLPTAGKALGGVKTTSTVTSAAGYTPVPIVDGVPYYKDTDTTYHPASASAAGLMAAADKAKLDGVAAGANKTVVDSALSPSSGNPISNKAVKLALDLCATKNDAILTGTPTAPTAAAGTNSQQIATTAFVQSVVGSATTSAMTYRGAAAAYGSITGEDYKAGWCWIVSTSGTFAGQACEPGDMVVANSAKAPSGAKDADFDVIQSNVSYVSADDVKSWFA